MSETTVQYEGYLRCSAEHSESGVVVVTNAPRDNHGNGASFSPSELLSVSLGSCILSIMGIMARSMDIDITGSTAKVEKRWRMHREESPGFRFMCTSPVNLQKAKS
jgi:putative redox protein